MNLKELIGLDCSLLYASVALIGGTMLPVLLFLLSSACQYRDRYCAEYEKDKVRGLEAGLHMPGNHVLLQCTS